MAGFDPRIDYSSSGALYESGALYDGFQYKGENTTLWRIELGFDLYANGVGDWFTLDDPVKGELDNTTYLLAGQVFVDLTRYARSLSVRRGRSRLLEKFTAGQCEVTFDNRDRIFDPLMTGGPFTGQIVPRKQMRVYYNGDPVFVGNVADWDFQYDHKDAVAIVKGLDGLAYLSSRTVPAQTMTAETPGDRIDHVLTQVGWDASARDIDPGGVTLAADVVGDNVNALTYLQKVEISQGGLFFVKKNGHIKYDSNYAGEWNSTVIGIDGGIPYNDISVLYGSEELTNKITVDYLSGGSAASVTVENTASETNYGILENTYSTLLSSADDATNLATLLVDRYSEPTYRIESVEFDARGLSSDNFDYLMNIELGDRLRLRFRPLQVGEVLYRTVLVDGIQHEVGPKSHKVSMSLTDLGYSGAGEIISGGVITEYTDGSTTYRLHSFTDPGSYSIVVEGAPTVDVLIIGGGAGGGTSGLGGFRGGGGSGGVLAGSLDLSYGTYPVVVGASGDTGVSGSDTTFYGFTAYGGGHGGASDGSDGATGGSGGGGGAYSTTLGVGGAATQDSQAPLTGYGSDGTDAADAYTAGSGGGASYTSSITGTSVTYARGGVGADDRIGVQLVVDAVYGDGEAVGSQVVRASGHGAVFIRYEVLSG